MPKEISTIANQQTYEAFNIYLSAHPNERRVTEQNFIDIFGWLTDPNKKPKSQKEFSRRNYVRQTFRWDNEIETLFNITGKDNKSRPVVIDHSIVDCVESAHIKIGHRGWDSTWKEVKDNYYGVLRSDVSFLLKRCIFCMECPYKRPKTEKGSLEREIIMNDYENECN